MAEKLESYLIRMIFGTRRVFGVADYELKIQKFKMAGPIWRTKMQIFTGLGRYLVLDGFWGR